MPDRHDDLPFGLYEQLITAALERRLLRFDPSHTRIVRTRVDQAEAHARLARHLAQIVARALRGVPADESTAKQGEIVNELVAILDGYAGRAGDDAVVLPPEELRGIHAVTALTGDGQTQMAPLVPLGASDLLVNARGEPGLAQNLAAEIPSADRIDLLCAFVRWHGLRVILPQLRAHLAAGQPLRVITTVYTGSTERKALDWLVEHGAKVKVSYDTESTRLHAKAWLFQRATGYSTAYIGSSNLSKAALVDGVEWNVRLSQVTAPEVLEKFGATFEQYWQSPEYAAYDPARDRETLDRALRRSGDAGDTPGDTVSFFDITAFPHQAEMLERLAVERARHARHRNLVVAATGTGKTVVAALDYRALSDQMGDPTLLFVAHRQEILTQSLAIFRHVLRRGDFGELYVDGHRPDEGRHVFASVQALAQVSLDELDPRRFDVVIVDEFHHAAAPTYRRLLDHLQPKELLGLTATPERADGESVLAWFGDHISVELRLWDALERGLLCPFQYFGLNDQTDLADVQWARRGYDVATLEHLYTGDDARVRLVLGQVHEKLRDPSSMRALGFCVSIRHAQFMADRFTRAGLPSLAVSADTDSAERRQALRRLERGEVRALFAVDLFNEGVDIPSVDTLLFLRPTESAVVFMQQLGRGLRRFRGKDCVTVLDFIGRANRKFRFDLRYRAITGGSRLEVTQQIQAGFPFLPAGCTMQLDRVVKSLVLDNLREAIPSRRPAMVQELRALAASSRVDGREVTLATFLEEAGLELEDVYRRGSWSALKRAAGLDTTAAGPQEDALGRALGRMLHLDDPLRLSAYRTWLEATAPPPLDEAGTRLVTGLHFTLFGAHAPATLADTWHALHRHPAIVAELLELLLLLDARAAHLTWPTPLPSVPLSVHARHSLVEILAAFARVTPGRFYQPREGVLRDEATASDLFFITLEKSERHYSPTTRYRDYAIAPHLFHWESQSTTTAASPTGQRYILHQQRGGHILLFVRHDKGASDRTTPYTFLGPADYVSHTAERPIQFVWQLHRPMPADFFRQAKVAAG